MQVTRVELVFLLAVVSLGGVLGSVSATRNPVYIDEITYARLGYSLSQGHLASDSSFLSLYSSYGLVRNDIVTPYGYIDSVQPWLDHPPLIGFALVPFVIAGANLRSLPALFDIGIILLLYFALRQRDRLEAGAAALFFLVYMSLFPVLTMLFLDSGVSFFLILTMYLAAYFERTGSTRAMYAAGLTAGLASLSKVPGVVAILFLVLFLVYQVASKKTKVFRILPSLVVAIGLASLWPIYGFLIEPGLFWQLTTTNFSRTTLSGNSLQQILAALASNASFARPDYTVTLDPLLIVSWAATLLVVSRKKYLVTSLALGSYLIVLFALRYVPPQMTVPLFPFFAVSLGIVSAAMARFTIMRLGFGRLRGQVKGSDSKAQQRSLLLPIKRPNGVHSELFVSGPDANRNWDASAVCPGTPECSPDSPKKLDTAPAGIEAW